ncbi:MAG: replication/maintenance protein RepL [Mariprofundaceae bacterium]|nr:replication/maintenance protein RepL [Mariprofundaceae bacterium]
MPSATKKNSAFIQLTDPDGIDAMRVLTKANAMAANVFYFLMKYMDTDNCLVVSMHTISLSVGVSRQTISKSVSYLKKHQYIAVFKSGTSNVYTLNSNIVWKDRGDKKVEALLYGAVLLSLDEQEPESKKNASIKKQLELIKNV